MKKSLFVASLVILTSCYHSSDKVGLQEKDPKAKDVKTAKKTKKKEVILQDKFKIDYTLVDNEFANNPFGYKKTAYTILKGLNPKRIELEPIANDYVDGQIDTLYTFYFDRSRIKIYKLPDRQFIVSALVRDTIITMKDNIRIGMSKKVFMNRFSKVREAEVSDKTFRIEVFENEQWVDFEFVDNRLAQAVFEGYID